MVREEYNHSRPVSALIRDWLLYSKASGGGGILKTVTGNPISVSDALAAPIKSLSVSLSPIQDLHGQDAPYPAGGGKNKYSPDGLEQVYYNSAGTPTINKRCVMSDYIAVTPGTAYTLSVNQTVYGIFIVEFDSGKNWIKNNNGSNNTKRTVTLDSNTAFVRCGINHDNTADMDVATAVETYHLQLEEGSTATAYAPYENICPISGRDNVTVWRGVAYDPSADPALTVQLGQTVYGGSVDVTGGKTEDALAIATFTGGFFQHPSISTLFYRTVSFTDAGAGVAYCNQYKYAAKAAASLLEGEFTIDTNYSRVALKSSAYATAADLNAYLAEHPLQVAYPLATTVEIEITPASLSTLRGDNTVWSDGDDVTMIYKAASS